jgi:hypothetical protein
MSGTTTPAQLLEVARTLGASTEWRVSGWATRAVLVRQAVEMWLVEYWEVTEPAIATSTRKAQFLLLHDSLPSDAAAAAHTAWTQLSHACHHRPFDLEPTLGQAQAWIAQAEAFRDALQHASRELR